MKKLYILTAIISFLAFTSCSKDDNPKKDEKGIAVSFETSKKVENLYAPSSGGYMPSEQKGGFVKFNFETGQITDSETDWDITFRYATILVNGGSKVGYDSEPKRTANVSAYIAKNSFEDLKKVDDKELRKDAKGKLAITDDVQNGKGIWSYNMKKHIVLPIPGRVLIFKTAQGKYVKMEVLSFYKDAPAQPKMADKSYGYYTFRYSISK